MDVALFVLFLFGLQYTHIHIYICIYLHMYLNMARPVWFSSLLTWVTYVGLCATKKLFKA